MGSLTLVLRNQATLLDSLFILIKDSNNLDKATQGLQCKELLYKVNLIINISNNQDFDKYHVNN